MENDGTTNESLGGVQLRSSNEQRNLSGLLGDRYEVMDVLGKGGMGTVFKARHALLNKPVAVKVLNGALLVDEVSRQRFEIEAQAGSQLTHPNLIAVFDYGFTAENEPYLVMEYVEGESLDRFIAGPVRPPLNDILPLLIQVCKALQYIHDNNVVHRDLKSSNIMLQVIGADRYAKLLDFGIAKVFSDKGETVQHLTATGMIYGSPLYMSPEQCSGGKLDSRCDIYAMGCVMYECVTGSPPLRGANPLQTLFKQVNDKPEPLPHKNAYEQEFASIVHKCLEKDPACRFQSANDLGAALNQVAMMVNGLPAAPLSARFLKSRTNVQPATSDAQAERSREGTFRAQQEPSSTGHGAPARDQDASASRDQFASQPGDQFRSASRDQFASAPRERPASSSQANREPEWLEQVLRSFRGNWMSSAFKVFIGLLLIQWLFNMFFGLSNLSRVWQLQHDSQASFDMVHEQLQRLNQVNQVNRVRQTQQLQQLQQLQQPQPQQFQQAQQLQQPQQLQQRP